MKRGNMTGGFQREILGDIITERLKQDAKFPEEENTDERWYAILGEEFGEIGRAILTEDRANLREELIQLAAVSVAWVEIMDEEDAE